MNHALLWLLVTGTLLFSPISAAQTNAAPPPKSALAPGKILFGSCSHQAKTMPILKAINAEQADVFLFLGDNIYGDTEDMHVLNTKYQQLKAQPGFQTLLDNHQIMAIWDDHDFGVNDGGREYPQKEASRQLMLDFFNVAADAPRRHRQDGIYTARRFGDDAHSVNIIMPDLRWNRPPINQVSRAEYLQQRKPANQGPYAVHQDPTASMLGEAQWQWLETELKKPAKIKIIASSLQLLPEFTGWEAWANFPYDRQRLLQFIAQHNITGVVIVSGDTHWGEVSRVARAGDTTLPYPLWEVTSSGLTEEWKHISPNRHRVSDATHEVNYGFITIDWQQPDPAISLGLKDVNGDMVTQRTLTLSELQP